MSAFHLRPLPWGSGAFPPFRESRAVLCQRERILFSRGLQQMVPASPQGVGQFQEKLKSSEGDDAEGRDLQTRCLTAAQRQPLGWVGAGEDVFFLEINLRLSERRGGRRRSSTDRRPPAEVPLAAVPLAAVQGNAPFGRHRFLTPRRISRPKFLRFLQVLHLAYVPHDLQPTAPGGERDLPPKPPSA